MRIANKKIHTVNAVQLNPTMKINKQDKCRRINGITRIQSISLPDVIDAYFSSRKELSNQKNNFSKILRIINLNVQSNGFF